MRNSKFEIRNSKEDRNSKVEPVGGETQARDGAESWGWGEETAGEAMALKEDGPAAAAPPSPDLTERAARFGEAIVRFAKKSPQNPVNNRLITQLVAAGTSVGANFCEANDAVSGKDFRKSVGTCRKESKETMFFLRMIAAADPSLAEEARALWREAKELNLIFGSIWRKRQ